MHRTTIMFPESLKSKLEKRAKKMRVSLGELIRMASEEYLAKYNRKIEDDPMVSGYIVLEDKGPTDVSANVDKYLYGHKK